MHSGKKYWAKCFCDLFDGTATGFLHPELGHRLRSGGMVSTDLSLLRLYLRLSIKSAASTMRSNDYRYTVTIVQTFTFRIWSLGLLDITKESHRKSKLLLFPVNVLYS